MTSPNQDKLLADRVIALSVGIYLIKGHPMQPENQYEILGDKMPPDEFVRDWRVAWALMEKIPNGLEYQFDQLWEAWIGEYWVDFKGCCAIRDKSLPRAIIEACVEVLERV